MSRIRPLFLFGLLIGLWASSKMALGQESNIHPYCPENALCGPEMGQYFKKWENWVDAQIKKQSKKKSRSKSSRVATGRWAKELDSFRQKNGLPTPLWFFGSEGEFSSRKSVLWDSSCAKHRTESAQHPPIQQSLMALKNAQGLKAPYTLTPHWLWDHKSKKVHQFWLPQGERPNYLKDGQAVIIRDEERFYYFLKISQNKEWKVISPKVQLHHLPVPKSTQCPKILREQFEKLKEGKKIYSGYSCTRLLDTGKKRHYVMLHPWNC